MDRAPRRSGSQAGGASSETVDGSGPNEALAWTRRGVLYCEGGALRVARHGRSRVLVRGGVSSVRISGDGRNIVTEHYNRTSFRGSIWYGEADGAHQRRLWLGPRTTTSTAARFGYPMPDFRGRHLLTERSDNPSDDLEGVVRWRVGSEPERAPVADFLAHADAFTWN